MNKLIERFRKELSELANYMDSTVAAYVRAVYSYESYAANSLGIEISQSKPYHITRWFASLRDDKGYVSSCLQTYKVSIKKYFDFLITLGVVDKNPAVHLPPVKGIQKDLKKIISKKSIQLLLGSFDKTKWIGMRNFIIVAILWSLGIRAGELAAIRLKDLNLNYDSVHRIGLIKIHGKGRKERTLFIVDKLYDELVLYLKHPDSPEKNSHALVCSLGKVKPLTPHRIWEIIREAAHKAGIVERITPHLLRHTFATDMYHQNVPVEAIMDMLGHDSLVETSGYIHVSEKLKAEALDCLSIERSIS
jgi:site-specific recombinase XerD